VVLPAAGDVTPKVQGLSVPPSNDPLLSRFGPPAVGVLVDVTVLVGVDVGLAVGVTVGVLVGVVVGVAVGRVPAITLNDALACVMLRTMAETVYVPAAALGTVKVELNDPVELTVNAPTFVVPFHMSWPVWFL
jgi:hypothetical protein